MKPHLKLYTSGRVLVLKKGHNAWSEDQAKRWIRNHYGSLQAFALHFNLPYEAVTKAVSHSMYEGTAGPVANVRAMLGLKSNPTKLSINLSNSQRGRRREGFCKAGAAS